MCLNCANIWAEFVQVGIRYLKAVKFLPLNEDQGSELNMGNSGQMQCFQAHVAKTC